MTENETYFIPFVVGIIALLLSSYIPRYGYKRWDKLGCALGCLLQPIAFFLDGDYYYPYFSFQGMSAGRGNHVVYP